MDNRSNLILFVGLGTMGLPMATNLVKAGFAVTGHDASAAAVDKFVAAGGIAAANASAAAQDADVVLTMVPDDRAVIAVLAAPDGLLAVMRPGALAIEMSTTSPRPRSRFAARPPSAVSSSWKAPSARRLKQRSPARSR